eukprot:TRINITY_DN57933_c0_g1_i1.p1 TRINITY_DN57933_c0_g1~~TRINITY_DN57933_c0_g1_i1.p1  ORF type:complete len:156 (-),score=22.03 TRINITY_DN57933_c0_g1_i1:14-481(-)
MQVAIDKFNQSDRMPRGLHTNTFELIPYPQLARGVLRRLIWKLPAPLPKASFSCPADASLKQNVAMRFELLVLVKEKTCKCVVGLRNLAHRNDQRPPNVPLSVGHFAAKRRKLRKRLQVFVNGIGTRHTRICWRPRSINTHHRECYQNRNPTSCN